MEFSRKMFSYFCETSEDEELCTSPEYGKPQTMLNELKNPKQHCRFTFNA